MVTDVSRRSVEDAEADVRWMRRALEQARRGLGRTTPNPVVGACVVTDEDVVVGDGAHERAGEAHAEIHALNDHGIAVDVGIERDAAMRLNQPFLTAIREGRPFVILKAAASIYCCMAE